MGDKSPSRTQPHSPWAEWHHTMSSTGSSSLMRILGKDICDFGISRQYLNHISINISILALSSSTNSKLDGFSVASFILVWFYAQVNLHFSWNKCPFIQGAADGEWSQLGLGFLQPPFPGADLWPGQGDPTGPSHIPKQQPTTRAAVTVPGEMWPCGTALHPDGLQQGQVATQSSWGDNHPPLKAHRHFCPRSQRGKHPCRWGKLDFQPWSSHCKGCIRECFPLERAARNFIPAFVCCFPCKSAFLSQKILH